MLARLAWFMPGTRPETCYGCMTSAAAPKAPVLVPFVCPVCAAPNGVNLIALSRAGHTTCVKCEKKLRAADVMRAMHDPRRG